MPTLINALLHAMRTVQQPGYFCTQGITEISSPRLEIEGVGLIALPLLPEQAQRIIAVAQQAPYGLGAETLVNTEVRNTWQLDADRVKLSGKHWQSNLDTIVAHAAAGLGVSGPVSAEFYKLLVYEAGSFFISHRDTEKIAGMFATLVIVLPSDYSGGELIVRHQGQEETLDLHNSDPGEVAFAAFYADCRHEVQPVTQGYRLTLIYNLLRTTPKGKKAEPLPQPPDYRQEQLVVADLFHQWVADLERENSTAPDKLVYLLEHAYTAAELDFDALKNGDIATVEVLVAAAKLAECDVHLALVSIYESGFAEYAGYESGRGRRRSLEEEFEVGEVDDSTQTLSAWQRLDNQPSPLGKLPFEAEELCPPDAFADKEPDELNFHEATGNEGVSFDRTYSHAAVVIWPRAHYFAVISAAGTKITLPLLNKFCQDWQQAGRPAQSKLWQEAHALAFEMLQCWPAFHHWGNKLAIYGESVREFLAVLYRLDDREVIESMWALIAQHGFYSVEDVPALVQAAQVLPWPRVVALIEQGITESADTENAACVAVLAGFAVSGQGSNPLLSSAAKILLRALPGDPTRSPQQSWRRETVKPKTVADLLSALEVIDPLLAREALDYLLAWPNTYPMDETLLPAALMLVKAESTAKLFIVVRLRQQVQQHLQQRISEVLEPPADWRRAKPLRCQCADCGQLANFLADSLQPRWDFKAVEARREHVVASIKQAGCDVDCTTNCANRPYTLVCTKNQASYDRRVAQRHQDLNHLAALAIEPMADGAP